MFELCVCPQWGGVDHTWLSVGEVGCVWAGRGCWIIAGRSGRQKQPLSLPLTVASTPHQGRNQLGPALSGVCLPEAGLIDTSRCVQAASSRVLPRAATGHVSVKQGGVMRARLSCLVWRRAAMHACACVPLQRTAFAGRIRLCLSLPCFTGLAAHSSHS